MEESDKILLPHHEQQPLCVTRLPYRQGRKLTAVKGYSVTKESNHLLIFGVPSLNLRQETKKLFIKFGKLLQFNITKQHTSEPFTETYHAQYERTQPARMAKKMLDTKNFYGGILHVCYAPELETVDETRQKLIQRQRDVVFRLKNLEKFQQEPPKPQLSISNVVINKPKKLNMGVINTISLGKEIKEEVVKKKKNKKFKPNHEEICPANSKIILECKRTNAGTSVSNISKKFKPNHEEICPANSKIILECKRTNAGTSVSNISNTENIEIVDCTNIDKEVITNINETLNYNKFGTEVIRKIPEKPLNKIQFHINKK